MSSDAQSSHLRLVTPPNNLTKALLLNLESYTGTREILRRLHEFEEPQLLRWNGQLSLTCHRLGAIEHQGFLGR
jgi:hypothetical protein